MYFFRCLSPFFLRFIFSVFLFFFGFTPRPLLLCPSPLRLFSFLPDIFLLPSFSFCSTKVPLSTSCYVPSLSIFFLNPPLASISSVHLRSFSSAPWTFRCPFFIFSQCHSPIFLYCNLFFPGVPLLFFWISVFFTVSSVVSCTPFFFQRLYFSAPYLFSMSFPFTLRSRLLFFGVPPFLSVTPSDNIFLCLASLRVFSGLPFEVFIFVP
ncbi:MAG: hypothetical protein BYD32DRAFT_260525 [Podila humilis]|nr:MAG: hypothetical protein BYD32DRAFT_260525 [Podila humilis]